MPASPIGLDHRSLTTLIPLSVVTVGLGWSLLFGSDWYRSMTRTQADSQATYRHPVYWFEDGSVIVRVTDNTVERHGAVSFRIHECLLRRHAKVALELTSEDGWDVPTTTLPPALGVHTHDFTALLAHLYHDIPLSPETPFEHVAAILRVSSPEQLNIPPVHDLARIYFMAMFPSGPSPFVHPNHLEEALGLALRYNITSIQKGIYYSLVTTTDFEPNPDIQDDSVHLKTVNLTSTDVERCRNLMNGIVEHFTPVLFEPPVTPHMVCTNLVADKWFSLVIQSAIAGDSVYKPLEALEQLKQIDWAKEGLCSACVREKREEWTNEQEEVWERMDLWLRLPSK